MATTVSTPQARTTPKGDGNGSGPPVGLIVAPILLCVLIAALIFLWIKYKKRKNHRGIRRKFKADKPLLSTSAYPTDEPVPSPGSASESVVFTDEQSEKAQNLDPIEERDDNPDNRVRSVRHAQVAAPRQQMLQEDHSESAEEQETPPSYRYHQYNQVQPYANPIHAEDANANAYEEQNYPSESGGEPEEEEPRPFRDRRNDSGYRSERTRPYYRDMYERYQPQLRPLQFDCHSNYSDDSEETVPKEVVPSAYLAVEPRSGKRLQNNVQEDSEDDSYAKKYIV